MNTEYFILKETDYPVFESLFRGDLNTLGPGCMAFGAVSDGEPSALAVTGFDPEEKSCWLLWLYVKNTMRKKGVGSGLLSVVMRLYGKSFLADTLFAPCMKEEQTEFLSACGFTVREDENSCVYEATLGDLKEVKVKKELNKRKDSGRRTGSYQNGKKGSVVSTVPGAESKEQLALRLVDVD